MLRNYKEGFRVRFRVDTVVKSRNMHNFVIPVKMGIQCF